ncbi:MAG: HlyD family efflux transporter periplasmic adaptor subunit [Planctomycetales bacterium]|nr:HlyD family efflux transporter periplasmic adaptor subunit [Planctomycetales bacterium]
MKRILIGVIAIVVLASLLISSKLRSEPAKVSAVIEADEIRLGSRVGGRVAEVRTEEGATIAPGQVLVVLDPFDLQQRISQARANLAAQQAELEKLQNGLRPEEIAQARARYDSLAATLQKLEQGPRQEEIAAAQANLDLATSQLERARRTFERVQVLRQNNTSSQEELDRATEEVKVTSAMQRARQEELQLLQKGTREEDLAAARANLQESEQAYELARNGFRKEDIEQARATVEAAQAAVDALCVQQAELSIKSDVAGVVSAFELRPGDLVPANGPVIAVLDIEHLWVRAYAPQSWGNLAVGRQLRVTVDGLEDRELVGEISFISPQAEFTPRNVQTPDERAKQVFRMKLQLHGETADLRPGMTADVWLDE